MTAEYLIENKYSVYSHQDGDYKERSRFDLNGSLVTDANYCELVKKAFFEGFPMWFFQKGNVRITVYK